MNESPAGGRNGRPIGLPQPLSVDLRVETPENVVLAYQLAGPASRLCAYLVDLLVRIVAALLVLFGLGITGIALPGLSTGAFFVFLFLLEWGYFVVFEGFCNGKTLGKHAFGLRVIHERGYPVTLWAALLRNLFRAADAQPLYGLAFVTMLCSRKFQRLGDLVSGTVVVTERRVVLPREPVILEKIDVLPREDLGGYVPEQRLLSLIDQYLGRRYVLSHTRGHALARILALPLAKALDFRGDKKLVEHYPMAFLARVYVTFLRDRDDGGDPREATGARPRAEMEAVR